MVYSIPLASSKTNDKSGSARESGHKTTFKAVNPALAKWSTTWFASPPWMMELPAHKLLDFLLYAVNPTMNFLGDLNSVKDRVHNQLWIRFNLDFIKSLQDGSLMPNKIATTLVSRIDFKECCWWKKATTMPWWLCKTCKNQHDPNLESHQCWSYWYHLVGGEGGSKKLLLARQIG